MESTDFGSNSDTAVQVRGAETGDRGGSIREATEDFGEMSTLGGGFVSAAGGLVDACLPNEGDKGKVQLAVNVPVDSSGTIKVGFNFVTEAERDDNGVKIRAQLGGAVTASQEIPLYFVTLEAFARAEVFGFIEAYGDTSAEAFELMLLAIQRRIANQSETVAGALFDNAHIQAVQNHVDSDDYVESGLGGSFSAGAGVSDGSGDSLAGVGASVGGTTGTRLQSNGRGGLNQLGVSTVEGALSGSFPPFGLEGKVKGKWTEGQLSQVEAEVSGQHELDMDQLGTVVGARWVSGVVGQLNSLITGGAGILNDDNAARRVGGITSTLSQMSMSGSLAEGAAAQALNNLEGVGVTIAHKITVKGQWDAAKGYGAEITLERVGGIQVGRNVRDRLYVLVENLQRVFQIKIGA
jgi:hypothetical protein